MSQKIKYSGAACLIDGVQAHRVQTLGHNTDISRTKLQELANSGAVQYIDNIPNVSITIDTNDIGSIDTLRMCTDQIIPYTLAAAADPRTSAFGCNIKSTASNSSNVTINQSNFLSSYVDIMVPVTNDDTAVSRTTWYHRCALGGISWGYDVNGYATENYSFNADNRTFFLNEYAGAKAIVLRRDNVETSGATSQSFHIDTAFLPASTYDSCSVIAIGFNEHVAYRSDATNWLFSDIVSDAGGPSFTLISKIANPVISTPFCDTSAGAKVVVIVKPSVTQTWTGASSTNDPGYKLVTTAGSIGGKSREYIAPKFYNTSGPEGNTTAADADTMARLQTVSIDVSPGSDPLMQLGQKVAFAYDIEEPLPIKVTMSAFDYDLRMLAMSAATSYATVDQITLDDLSGANAISVEIYADANKTSKLKTINLTQMEVTGINDSVGVGGNATTEMTFDCSYITCTGSGTNPNQ